MRCRWVLTWKPTPEESLEESLEEIQKKPESTTFTADGKKKAKARIVRLVQINTRPHHLYKPF